jgi:hypothetical protein
VRAQHTAHVVIKECASNIFLHALHCHERLVNCCFRFSADCRTLLMPLPRAVLMQASSNSQFVFPPVVLGSHPLSQGGIEALQSGPFALGSLGGAASSGGHDGLEAGLAARPRSKKYKVSRGGRAAGAGAGSIAGAAAAPAGDDAGAGSESAAGSEEDGAQAAAGAGSADGSSTAASAAVPGADAPAAGQAREHGGDSSVAAEGPWGSRRGSNASSCDSSDAVSPSVSPEPVVTLTPSTDEARPPVSR